MGAASLARNASELWRDPLGFFARLATEQGDFAHVRLGWQDLYLVNRAELVHELMVTRHASFSKGMALARTRSLLGNGLMTSEGSFHRRQRNRIRPAFRPPRIAGYIDAMTSTALDTQAGWQHGQVLEISAEMLRLAQRVVGKSLFDIDLGAAQARAAGEALETLVHGFGLLLMPGSALWLRLPLPATTRLRRAQRELEGLVLDAIAERRRSGDHGDLLSSLLFEADDDGQTMPLDQVRDEVMTLFLAGHDTTGNALAWTWYLLSGHPEIEAEWHAELDQVLAGRVPKAEDIQKLTLTRRLFAESMRLFPPVPAVGRQAREGVSLGGRSLPKGAVVEVCPWLLHRDPHFFPEPDRFDPGRWTPAFERALPAGAYVPFGIGARHCVGMPFAWASGIALLATLGQRWRLRHDGAPIEFLARSITLRPRNGLTVKLARR